MTVLCAYVRTVWQVRSATDSRSYDASQFRNDGAGRFRGRVHKFGGGHSAVTSHVVSVSTAPLRETEGDESSIIIFAATAQRSHDRQSGNSGTIGYGCDSQGVGDRNFSIASAVYGCSDLSGATRSMCKNACGGLYIFHIWVEVHYVCLG